MRQRTDVEWQRVAKLDDVKPGHPCGAVAGGLDLVLVRSKDGVRAYEARCPHQGTLLSEGEIAGDHLVCRAHGWRFDLATGERRGGSPNACLRPYAVEIAGGEVLVQIETNPRGEAKDSAPKLRSIKDLPGPRGWPIFGNALQIDVPRVHEILENWSRTYGPLYRASIMGNTIVVVNDADIGETLLRARPQSVRRVSMVEPVFAEMGIQGVFSAEGASWRAQRRLAMEALSSRHLRGFFPTLRRVAERLHARWDRSAAAGSELEIQDDLMRFTVDVTTSLVFSTDMNTLEGGDNVLQRHLSHVFPALARRLLAPFPYWRYVRLPADRALDRALAEVRRLQDRLVSETRARLSERPRTNGDANDFLEAMLLARDEEGRPFPDEAIHGNMLTMLLAGEDTTAYTLSWAAHYLCDRPDVVARMRNEVDAALSNDRTPHAFESAQSLPYLDAVANETMRLKPVAPFFGLEANEDLIVGDVFVPKGTWIDLLTRLPAIDSNHFEDPDVFRPERWLGEQPSGDAHAVGASIPFGSGPRICPGRSLALLEMRVVLATLVRNFDIERVGLATDVREHFSFTMSPRGLRVRFRRRAAAARRATTTAEVPEAAI
jgi:cytochrome P450/nitrite reductase/ring-hydroxylating ferredoxin subunit